MNNLKKILTIATVVSLVVGGLVTWQLTVAKADQNSKRIENTEENIDKLDEKTDKNKDKIKDTEIESKERDLEQTSLIKEIQTSQRYIVDSLDKLNKRLDKELE